MVITNFKLYYWLWLTDVVSVNQDTDVTGGTGHQNARHPERRKNSEMTTLFFNKIPAQFRDKEVIFQLQLFTGTPQHFFRIRTLPALVFIFHEMGVISIQITAL